MSTRLSCLPRKNKAVCFGKFPQINFWKTTHCSPVQTTCLSTTVCLSRISSKPSLLWVLNYVSFIHSRSDSWLKPAGAQYLNPYNSTFIFPCWYNAKTSSRLIVSATNSGFASLTSSLSTFKEVERSVGNFLQAHHLDCYHFSG